MQGLAILGALVLTGFMIVGLIQFAKAIDRLGDEPAPQSKRKTRK
jgi:hypothetical protein